MRKRHRKLTILLTTIIMCSSILGCGSTDSSSTQTYAWPLGTSSPEDTVTQIYAEKFAEEVYNLSDGAMRIQVYPNSVLGGDRELLESCKDGDIPFIVQNTAPQVTFLPDIAIFDMPCLFSTIEDVRTTVDNPEFMDAISDIYVDGGYRLLGYADQGFRVMTSNTPVYSISDFKGQKIRTMENSYHMAFWKQLKAAPTPMTFSEVYIGLQQGTIDAQENPYEVIVSNRLYEQQNYVIETNHLPHLISLVASDEFMNELTPEQQEIINQAAEIATKYARAQSDARIASRIDTIVESGTTVIPLDDELRQEIRDASTPVYESIKENVDPNLYEIYTKNILE